jgi:hypothetical protein
MDKYHEYRAADRVAVFGRSRKVNVTTQETSVLLALAHAQSVLRPGPFKMYTIVRPNTGFMATPMPAQELQANYTIFPDGQHQGIEKEWLAR